MALANAAIGAAVVGILFALLPTGSFHRLSGLHPALVGINPSFSPPKQHWGYSFDKLHSADLSGQVALVTGANSGIGFEISKALSRQGASVTLACRNEQRCNDAVERIQNDSQYSGASVSPLIMDTSSLKSVQSAAGTFLHINDKLDMLFLNAGVVSVHEDFDGSPRLLSEDGIELVFATNVVGHHLLYRLTEPLLVKSKMARVVSTSSFMSYNTFHYGAATDLPTLNDGDTSLGHSLKVYGESKLAQILLAKAAAKRLQAQNVSNVYVNAANPGIVRTPIQYRHTKSGIAKWFQDQQSMWNAEEGALTPLFLAVATEDMRSQNVTGKFYSPMGVEVIQQQSLDEVLQDRLWGFCEELVRDFI